MNTELLAQVPLFAGLGPEELLIIHQLGVRRKIEPQTILFMEDGAATTLYIVLAGRCRVTRQSALGQVVMLHLLEPGDVLGCAILGGAKRYPGTAEMIEAGVVLAFDEQAIAKLVARFPVVAQNALKLLSGRMEDLRVRLQELSTERVDQRLASALLRLTHTACSLPLSRQELAEAIGSTQYTVSRLLSRWDKAGWLEVGRQRLSVLDREALKKLASGQQAG